MVNDISRDPFRITWLSVSCTNDVPDEIAIASYATPKSMPAPLATVSASAQETRFAVARKLVITFKTLAEPRSPVCKIRRPMIVRNGNTVSNVERSQPAKIEILPVSARWHPPDTGQSTAAPPRSITILPRRFTSASSVVDISNQIFPSRTWGNI